jgi:hypothetical protein
LKRLKHGGDKGKENGSTGKFAKLHAVTDGRRETDETG